MWAIRTQVLELSQQALCLRSHLPGPSLFSGFSLSLLESYMVQAALWFFILRTHRPNIIFQRLQSGCSSWLPLLQSGSISLSVFVSQDLVKLFNQSLPLTPQSKWDLPCRSHWQYLQYISVPFMTLWSAGMNTEWASLSLPFLILSQYFHSPNWSRLLRGTFVSKALFISPTKSLIYSVVLAN